MNKKPLQKFTDWCNLNQGLLTFIALLFTAIGLIPEKIDFGVATNVFQCIIKIAFYKLSIPIYYFLILFVVILLYVLRMKKRYSPKAETIDLLVGKWKNEWTENQKTSTEILNITNDSEYFVNGIHFYNIQDLKIDKEHKRIQFNKTAIRPNDTRKYYNDLKIVNNDKLEGYEILVDSGNEKYKISYSKISGK